MTNAKSSTVQGSYSGGKKSSTLNIVAKQFARSKTALVGLIIISLLVLMAIFAPLLAPYDYKAVDPLNANMLPCWAHPFGTDTLGRDILSRIIWGARYSLSIGISASVIGTLIGIVLGTIAGYFGGVIENLILRFCDVLESIPRMLLCIIVAQSAGTGFIATVLALAVGIFPGIIRLLRATMLNYRSQEFVEAAKALNCSNARVMFIHVFPNCVAPIIVNFSIGIGMNILTSASLSFLGLGIQEPTPEWGAMIAAGRSYFRYYPHLILFPGIFVALVVLSFNLVGDGLRDALDPKLRS